VLTVILKDQELDTIDSRLENKKLIPVMFEMEQTSLKNTHFKKNNKGQILLISEDKVIVDLVKSFYNDKVMNEIYKMLKEKPLTRKEVADETGKCTSIYRKMDEMVTSGLVMELNEKSNYRGKTRFTNTFTKLGITFTYEGEGVELALNPKIIKECAITGGITNELH
jgi:hypothetical protein